MYMNTVSHSLSLLTMLVKSLYDRSRYWWKVIYLFSSSFEKCESIFGNLLRNFDQHVGYNIVTSKITGANLGTQKRPSVPLCVF